MISIFHDLLYLVLDALARLQAGKDLALDRLDPQLPLLVRGRLKVPRLTGQRHDDELEGIFLLWKTDNDELALKASKKLIYIGAVFSPIPVHSLRL